jgi:NAD-dependent dihydropyrimidine dehydrogenase PreA subunit
MYTVTVDIEKCEACGDCVDMCPSEVLAMGEVDGREVAMVVAPDDCIGCEACVGVCPTDSITVTED